jgi:RNA polymerase sigma-70 factor (ECF subfamily)
VRQSQAVEERFGEERILYAVAEGDPNALARLYERYADMLYGLAFRLTESTADAEDIVHDVFVGLPEAIRSYEGRGSFEGWLKRVTVRRALVQLRQHRIRRETPLSAIARLPTRTSDPGVKVTLDRALASLPERMRVVVVLKEAVGLSHTEIARLLGIQPGTSMDLMYKARLILRRKFGER